MWFPDHLRNEEGLLNRVNYNTLNEFSLEFSFPVRISLIIIKRLTRKGSNSGCPGPVKGVSIGCPLDVRETRPLD